MFNKLLKNISKSPQFTDVWGINNWLDNNLNLENLPYNIRIKALSLGEIFNSFPNEEFYADEFWFKASFNVEDNRNDNKPIELSFHTSCPNPATTVDILRVIRSIVLRIMIHEADENIIVDSLRVFDPHDKDTLIEYTQIVNDIVHMSPAPYVTHRYKNDERKTS